MKFLKINSSGYIVLLGTIVISAIGTAISVSLLLFGISSAESNRAITLKLEAQALAEACSETALQQLRDNTLFSGSGNLNLGNGTCSYTVYNLGGNIRRIDSIGTVEEVTQKLRVEIDQLFPEFTISLHEYQATPE